MAQTAASAAAISLLAPTSRPSMSVQLPPTTASLRAAYWHKDEDDEGSWFMNRHGVLLAVVDDVYYGVDTSPVMALADLPPGDYTHEEIAAAIAEDERAS